MKIKNSTVLYIEALCVSLLQSMRAFNKEAENDDFIYSSSNRARFERLRIELAKELIAIQKTMYNKST